MDPSTSLIRKSNTSRGVTRDAQRSGGELAADLGEVALLFLIEDGEGGTDALGVLGEQTVDDLAAAEGERDAGGAAVGGQAGAGGVPASLERRDDLGRVGLRRAQALAQRAQLELAAGGRQHDQDREARRRDALPFEIAG